MMNSTTPRKFLAFSILVLWVIGCWGCASLGTYNPATERREFIVIPTDNEVLMGRDLHPDILKQYPLSADAAQTTRVQAIGQRLAAVSDRRDYNYEFYLLEQDELNAFTIPGGRVYVFNGLVKKLKSDDEIASVLAHEIGHCAARHTIKKFQAAVAYDLIGSLILSQAGLEEQVERIVSLSSNGLRQLVFSAYSRKDEFEADHLGLKYMQAAGFDLEGMVGTLELLEKTAQATKIPLFLQSHPYLRDRISSVKSEIALSKQ